MKYFEFRFEHKTRPMFRKGTNTREFKSFAANDLTEAYRIAKEYWDQIGRGRQCRIILARELREPQ